MPIKIKQKIKPVDKAQFANIIDKINNAGYVLKKETPVSQTGHFHSFHYIVGQKSFSVSHDTKAGEAELAAEKELLEELKLLLAISTPKADHSDCQQKETSVQKKPAKITKKTAKKVEPNNSETTLENAQKNQGGVFCLKKCPFERFEGVLKAIKELHGIKLKSQNTVARNTKQETFVYDFEGEYKQKISIQYMKKSMTAQLQGKTGELFKQAQILMMEESDYLSAMKSYIEFSKEQDEKKAEQQSKAEIQREGDKEQQKASEKKPAAPKKKKTAERVHAELKKRAPYAFPFLSDQSKLLLSLAIVDLQSDLNNYTGILVTAYNGLENLISNVQKERKIFVRSIGLAFDRKDNYYVLKPLYANRIGSIVFNEAISALYTEYYKRNFFAHSDNKKGVPRIIDSQKEAERILNELLEIINYNCRKLDEIGYSLNSQKQ